MESLILTRYLFSLDDVRHSLFIEILDKNYEKALYWTYELYWSGYEDDTFTFLITNLYELMYDVNEEFHNRIKKEYEDWLEDNSKYENIGNIVVNLCFRNYKISKFVNAYFNIQCNDELKEEFNTNLYINLQKSDVNDYLTEQGNYTLLKKVYKYELRTETNILFDSIIDKEKQREELLKNWEYYAYKCPYWKNKFDEHNAEITENKITFINVEEEEKFYNSYNLEIDEQSKDIQNIAIGINSKELDLKSFLEKYGGKIITKKIKKNKK